MYPLSAFFDPGLAEKFRIKFVNFIKFCEIIVNDEFGIQIKIGNSNEGPLGENFIVFNYRIRDRDNPFYTYGQNPTNYFLLLKPLDQKYWNPLSKKDRKIMMAFRSFRGLVKYVKRHYPQFVK